MIEKEKTEKEMIDQRKKLWRIEMIEKKMTER